MSDDWSAMAIALEFIDFIVPVAKIAEKYQGGLERCLSDHAQLMGRRVWHDGHLFRDGAMSPAGIGRLIDEWEGLGFTPTEVVSGVQRFKDVCVVETAMGGPTLACDWLDIDWAQRVAYLKGTSPGAVVGRGARATAKSCR